MRSIAERWRAVRQNACRNLISRLQQRPSELFRRLELQILTDLTARAFRKPGRPVIMRHSAEGLDLYARFTKQCIEQADTDLHRLYAFSFRLGKRIRCLTGFTEEADLERLLFFLYRNIDITMRGSIRGGFVVPHCFFSHFYTPEECRVMSVMDSGIAAGICGGKRLAFFCRITEGCSECRAMLKGV